MSRTARVLSSCATVVVAGLLLSGCASGASDPVVESLSADTELPVRDDCSSPATPDIQAGCEVMDDFLTALVTGDAEMYADVNNYPQIRSAAGVVSVWPTREDYLRDNSAENLASKGDSPQFPGWTSSRWDKRQLVQSDESTMHFAVEGTRLNQDGEPLAKLRSFYVITRIDGHWGIQIRSSYAGIANNAGY